jgi:hypothetical protein
MTESINDTDFVDVPPLHPTEKAIEEMAVYLGADPVQDRDLFYIAENALTATLPPGWRHLRRADGVGDPFFFNSRTGESVWSDPSENYYKDVMADAKKKKDAARRRALSHRHQSFDDRRSGKSRKESENDAVRHQLKTEIEALRASHAGESAQLRKAHEANLAELRTAFEKEKAAAQAAHANVMQALREKQEQELETDDFSELKTYRHEDTQILSAAHTASIEKLKADHRSHIENLQKSHDEEITQIKTTFVAEKLKLEQELTNAHETEKAELQQLQLNNQRQLEELSAHQSRELDLLRNAFEQEKQQHEAALQSLQVQSEGEKRKLQAELNHIRAAIDQGKQKLRNLLKAKREEKRRHKHLDEERSIQVEDEPQHDRDGVEQDERHHLAGLRSTIESRKSERQTEYAQLKFSHRERIRKLQEEYERKIVENRERIQELDETFSEEMKVLQRKHEKAREESPPLKSHSLSCNHYQLSIIPELPELKRPDLSLSQEISMSTPAQPFDLLSHAFTCIASFAPSETHSVGIAAVDVEQLSHQHMKMRRMEKEFDSRFFNLASVMKSLLEEIKVLRQGYGDLIGQQCWVIQQSAINFQSEIATISQQFRHTLSLGMSFLGTTESPRATMLPEDGWQIPSDPEDSPRRRGTKYQAQRADLKETEIERKIREWRKT